MSYYVSLMIISISLLFCGSAVAQNTAPEDWGCLAEHYEDGVCDCGCVVPDRDCAPGKFDVCERNGCAEGQVPWEHRPTSCMRSACGDGWVDERLDELCDDGEALNSGGCNADCSRVNQGWTCGSRAEQCSEEVIIDSEDVGTIIDSEDVGTIIADVGLTDEGLLDMGSQELERGDTGLPELTQDASVSFGAAPVPRKESEQAGGCSFQSGSHHGLPIFLLSFVGVFIFRSRRKLRS